MAKRLQLENQQFGRLIVLEYAGQKTKSGNALWKCRCTCGVELLVAGHNLRNGHSTSCGCVQAENRFRHGHTGHRFKSPEYQSWANMIQRVTNPNVPRYPDYGGRGIVICTRWFDFSKFVADMGLRPEGTTIHRINNDGNYEPGNCRWATTDEQNANKRPRRKAA